MHYVSSSCLNNYRVKDLIAWEYSKGAHVHGKGFLENQAKGLLTEFFGHQEH